MTDLTRRTLLDPLALDGRDYVASLLAEGQRCGLLSDRDLSRLQGESLTLLAERADAWSHGLSTSLPAERAQQLLGSVLYIVSLELKAGPTPEEAVERLRREPLAALYAAGQKRITRKLQAARTLHRQLKKTLFPTPNQFYRATLADGVDGFFKLYRPALAAQEIHITADYPTFFGLPPLDGVEFMEEYLRCLSHENRFLRCFAPETVHALLLGLDENYHLLRADPAERGPAAVRPGASDRPADRQKPSGDGSPAASGGGGVHPRRGLPGGSVRLPPPQRAGAGGRCDPRRIAGPSGGGAPASRRAVTPCIFRPKWVQ